ncbi:hypothetical protein F511_13612 [Dorcoceras hygrometricum]|uniref:UBC core domain-containing protein n=1 Tax=Dorcoceras hygrometricum TaxID=472368 RepID=A0A2Z7AR18_9LAMI|nr:hypothetical protein F511_13612 [Dorcoceras hygrometricum]
MSSSLLTMYSQLNEVGPYLGGVWKVRVELPDAYPYKSPSIGFINKIYHPNVDEIVYCVDYGNSDLVNVFEVFLPQLLLYPNPSDPLNGEAAALMMRDRSAYEQRVKVLLEVRKYLNKRMALNHYNGIPRKVMECLALVILLDVLLLGKHCNWVEHEEYCLKYAKPEDVGAAPEEKSSDDELSEEEYDSSDEAIVGKVDP